MMDWLMRVFLVLCCIFFVANGSDKGRWTRVRGGLVDRVYSVVCGYIISFIFRSMNMRNAMSIIIMLISIMSFLLITG